MQNFKAWLLTEGAHGMISQVEGLAKALNTSFVHKRIVYNSFWSIFPPSISPRSKIVFNFTDIFKNTSTQDSPNIIISCGRKSVIPSIFIKNYIKKTSNKIVSNIHIQDPKIKKKNFDYIIAPDHDSLNGDNIIISKGALHYITREEIHNTRKLCHNKNILTIILGGPNRYYSFLLEELKILIDKIEIKFFRNSDEVRFVSSRRTPLEIINFLKNKYKNNDKVKVDTQLSRESYVKALSQAKRIVVTSDSISMISEAATTGSPIFLARLIANKNDYRFDKFLELFKKLNIVKDLDTLHEHWTYEQLYETKRIAELLKKKINTL